MTTGQLLGQFRRDLMAEGFDESWVDILVKEAMQIHLGSGDPIVVSGDQS